MGHAPRQAVRHEQASPSHAHNRNRQFDMAETAKFQVQHLAVQKLLKLRHLVVGTCVETIVRPTDSSGITS